MALVLPPALRPGDLVAVVAPSSPFDARVFWPGLAWVRDRYRVRVSSGVLSREGYLAGTDERRASELASAMRDPEIKAILAARGGYGAMRILGDLPWDELRRRPKWIVGFSDVTALHAMAWREGVASIHGPNVTGLGERADAWTRAAWLAALEKPEAIHRWQGLGVVRSGPRVRGPVIGGNLALIAAMAGAGRLTILPGAILVLEDVTERPYRIDRMLTALRLGGHLARAGAILFGTFEQCEPGRDGTTVEQVILRCTSGLGIPVLTGAPIGHGAWNDAFVIGSDGELEGDTLTFGARGTG